MESSLQRCVSVLQLSDNMSCCLLSAAGGGVRGLAAKPEAEKEGKSLFSAHPHHCCLVTCLVLSYAGADRADQVKAAAEARALQETQCCLHTSHEDHF